MGARAHYGRVSVNRKLNLPRDADADLVSAELVDGVLTVTAPKRARAEPRELSIEGASQAEPSDAMPEQDAGTYRATLLVPGLRRSDVKVAIDAFGVLSIVGETQTAHRNARIDRQVQLPSEVDADATHVSLIDGVLAITAPKKCQSVRQLVVGVSRPA